MAVSVFFIAEIFSRLSSFAKVGAEKATISAEAKMLFTNTLELANLISDGFLLTKQFNATKTRAKLSLLFLQYMNERTAPLHVGLWTIELAYIVVQVNFFHL